MSNDNKSFNERRVNLEQNAQILGKCAQNTIKNMQLAKAAAYRMAVDFVAIRANHLSDLLNEVETRWPKDRDGVDKWIAEEFKPYIAIGGNPYELFRMVKEGVTQKDFLSELIPLPLNRKAKAASIAVAGEAICETVPTQVEAEMPLEDQVRLWRNRAKALEEQVKQLRPLRGEVELLRKKLRQLQAVINKVPA